MLLTCIIIASVALIMSSYGNYSNLHFISENNEVNDYACEISGVKPEWLQGSLVRYMAYTFSPAIATKLNKIIVTDQSKNIFIWQILDILTVKIIF